MQHQGALSIAPCLKQHGRDQVWRFLMEPGWWLSSLAKHSQTDGRLLSMTAKQLQSFRRFISAAPEETIGDFFAGCSLLPPIPQQSLVLLLGFSSAPPHGTTDDRTVLCGCLAVEDTAKSPACRYL